MQISGSIEGKTITAEKKTLRTIEKGVVLIQSEDGQIHEVFSEPQGFSDGNSLHGIAVEAETERQRIIRERFHGSLPGAAGAGGSAQAAKIVKAPMPGMVKAVLVEVGSQVKRSTPVILLEAMKMENSISAGFDGVVKEIYAEAGSSMEKNANICIIE